MTKHFIGSMFCKENKFNSLELQNITTSWNVVIVIVYC